jgi:C-terminal processing protease CtpA/Prc
MSKQLIARRLIVPLLIIAVMLGIVPLASGQDSGQTLPPAVIVNDEGGAVHITGKVTYTNVFFTAGVSEPLIITEDEAGFVDRDHSFLLPLQSQTIGQITSDFYTSPFTYSIALPIEPQGSLRDVDNNGQKNTGVQIFAIAYWTNTFGDSFLEKRDLGGGGWSTDYASTRVSSEAANNEEIIGGKLLIYAPDDQQGFPSGFGPDGRLFTADDPTVRLPQGYTVVDMDTDPFTFDRSHEQEIDLNENPFSVLNDFSQMSYTDAFDAMINLLRHKYAFTDYKHIDWDQKSAEFRPRFVKAQADQDSQAYKLALRDFAWSIPDGHIGGPLDRNQFIQEAGGGLGMAIRQLDDGRILVNYVLKNGPADQAGIQLRTEVLKLNDQPIADVVSANVPWTSPFSTDTARRLEQLRFAIRFPVGTKVKVTFQNPGDTTPTTVTLTTVAEWSSYNFSSPQAGLTGTELPVEYSIFSDGNNSYGYVKVYSFFDDERLTAELWERMISAMKDNNVSGIILDMRQNGGGNGFLANQMAGYFFSEQTDVGNTGYYAEDINAFYFDPETEQYMYPPTENLQYSGPLAVLVAPSCASACEFFSYDLTLQNRALIVGEYPTAGLGGSVEQFAMPDGVLFQYTKGRAVDAQGNIHIEGKGVVPTVRVPVTEATLFSQTDPVIDAAVQALQAK